MEVISGSWQDESKKGHIQKNDQNGLVNDVQYFANRRIYRGAKAGPKPASFIIWISKPGSCVEPDSKFCLSPFPPASGLHKSRQEWPRSSSCRIYS